MFDISATKEIGKYRGIELPPYIFLIIFPVVSLADASELDSEASTKVHYYTPTKKIWLSVGCSTERLPSELCNLEEEISFPITTAVRVHDCRDRRLNVSCEAYKNRLFIIYHAHNFEKSLDAGGWISRPTTWQPIRLNTGLVVVALIIARNN